VASSGTKADSGKPRLSLLPWDAVLAVVAALDFGARAHGETDDDIPNWERVPDAHRRYWNACMRHLIARRRGEFLDPESRLPHLAHAAADALILVALDLRKT
jgi:hypothetical protein